MPRETNSLKPTLMSCSYFMQYPCMLGLFLCADSPSAGGKAKLAGVCSALKKHSEAFHLCEALDPVKCMKQLHSKQHVPRSTVRDVERSALKGRHAASVQCLLHVLQLSDAGLQYFVDKYLHAQHLDLLAMTLVQCPGDGVCELASAEYHDTKSTSTAKLPMVATVSSFTMVRKIVHKSFAFLLFLL